MIGLVDDGSGRPIHERVASHIRKLINDGAISPGARLPAQRMLAKDWSVSRNTVTTAFQQLVSEGVLEARVGSGTYVSAEAISLATTPRKRRRTVPSPRYLPLDVGAPDIEMFPLETWNRTQAQCWRRMTRSALQEGHPAGWPDLREIIADRVGAMRGLSCEPEQVFVTSSSQAAVALATSVLTKPGDVGWMEDPGYWRTRDAMSSAGVAVLPVPLDEEGFNLAAARRGGPARVVSLTTCAQFPTGVTMSSNRRAAMLAWASEEGSWIIEDDFESDFYFDGPPPLPLAADALNDRVVYVGTFNNILFPALRVAFLVAPKSQIDAFLAAPEAAMRASSTSTQIVLHAFMDQGHLAAHIRNCREVFADRRSILIENLAAELGSRWTVHVPKMGLLVQAWLPADGDDLALKETARNHGVIVSAMRGHAQLPTRPGLFLGFAAHSNAAIRKAVRGLARAADIMPR